MSVHPDPRIPGYLGRILDDGVPSGTCFQVGADVLVTAFHVLDDLGADTVDAVVAVDPLRGGDPRPARVVRTDPLHDLAVLVVERPLPACVPGLTATDALAPGTAVLVTGVVDVEDPEHTTRYLDAGGTAAGGTTRDDQIRLGRIEARAVMRGMSGAPVLAGDRVAGVVSARYNSADGWGRDSVWTARVEDLEPLLAGLTDVTVVRTPRAAVVELTLTVTDDAVRLHGDGIDVSAGHDGLSSEPAADSPVAVGRLLARAFLPEPVAGALAGALADARTRWVPILLGVDTVADELRALPWEALELPDAVPAALHPLLVVYRRAATAAARTGPVGPPGPLRIVVAIAAPLDGGSGMLDHERELRNMLAAVRTARQGHGAARVRIVHFATTGEIHAALAAEPAHVLHLSGHSGPGHFELEDDDGNARRVTAAEFVDEAIPPERMPAVVALSACHTDATTAAGDPSFAAGLIERGARVVIGTGTAITDVYATRVFTHVYGDLAAAPVPDVVAAVARARRAVHRQMRDATSPRERRLAGLGEWAVLTVLAGSGSLPLFDPAATPVPDDAPTTARPPAAVPAGLLARDVGEFVGRRREQRRWPAELLDPGGIGLVLHGIGGVGKTTLAAELIRHVAHREPGRQAVLLASGLTGATLTVDTVLGAVARALRRRGLPAVADELARDDVGWQDRWAVLAEDVLDTVPLLLVLDNVEDNLTPGPGGGSRTGWRSLTDPDLAALLAGLVTRPGRARLLVTSRHPFTLPGHADRLLTWRPIGPLSHAETMKLTWALPGLDRLTEPELERVNRLVGGHPRCLEYLDALLRGGRGSFPDVTARLLAHVGDRLDVDDVDAWLDDHRTLEPALAATLTQAADEVLLDRLVAGLADVSGAEDLLLGVSVYRRSVDRAGLLFQVGEPDPDAATDPAAVREDVIRDPRPPRRAPADLRRRADACTASSLLAVDANRTPPGWFVHRWTAAELARRWHAAGRGDRLRAAHERAAGYWRWRLDVWPQDREADDDDLDEARYHLLAAGDLPSALRASEVLAGALHGRGAWDRETTLIRETLAALPDEHVERSTWIRQLADVTLGRGRVAEAEPLYRQALELDERKIESAPDDTGFRRALSISYDRLGTIARDGGDRPEAARRFRQSLAVHEQLAAAAPDDTEAQFNSAVLHGKLAGLAHDDGDRAAAARLCRRSLAILEQLAAPGPDDDAVPYRRDREVQDELARCYHRLAVLARDDGDRAEATRLHRQSITITERLVALVPDNIDLRRSLSTSYTGLADLARDEGDRAEATRLHRQSLAIAERLAALVPDDAGVQRDLSVTYERLGALARSGGDLADAAVRHRQALAVRERLLRLAPDSPDYQQMLWKSYTDLVDLAPAGGPGPEIRGALDLVTTLLGAGHPLTVGMRARLDPDAPGG